MLDGSIFKPRSLHFKECREIKYRPLSFRLGRRRRRSINHEAGNIVGATNLDIDLGMGSSELWSIRIGTIPNFFDVILTR